MTCNCSLLHNATGQIEIGGIHIVEIIIISAIFCLIGAIGIFGNTLVIAFVLYDKKMRSSTTNMFITNLAVADLILMVFNIPELFMFLLNHGWVMGETWCKVERFILVFAVYASVLTLVAVCIERFIAIIHPMRAHIVCSRRRILLTIALIWPFCLLCATPVLVYNTVSQPPLAPNLSYCSIRFPNTHLDYFIPYKFIESVLYYYIPMISQLILYPKIINKLAKSHRLHREAPSPRGAAPRRRDAIRLRKSVVKMLMASVIIYFISYSPHQIMLIYNTVSPRPFHRSWMMLVLCEMMTFINSASNPILYCIFSHNFRSRFYGIFKRKVGVGHHELVKHHQFIGRKALPDGSI